MITPDTVKVCHFIKGLIRGLFKVKIPKLTIQKQYELMFI